MNDSDIPKPPPDDFSKTTPNIPVDDSDWGKTNYNHPVQPPSDDWGNTVANVRHNDMDFDKTFMPGSEKPKTPDWGITQGDIKLPNDDFGGGNRGGNEHNATMPYFRLPEAERAKYQPPPTPTEEAQKRKEEEKAKGGIPTWLWVSGGLFSMFFFAIAVLLLVYFIILKGSGYEATVKGAPAGSSVLVNGAYWGTTSDDGSISLSTLKAGETKKIEIKHPNYVCESREIKGADNVKPEPIIASCKLVEKPIADECLKIKSGEIEKAERCANKALDDLGANFSVDDLLRALNLFIINFESGKFDIPPARTAFLQKAATYIQKLPPSVVIEVGGHTDNVGSDASNQVLSENRAKAVKDALVKFGVKAEALTEKGYGKAKPKTTNDTEDGKFQNRRIEYSAIKR